MADRTAFDEVRELRAENERLQAEVDRRCDDVTEAYEERNHAATGWKKTKVEADRLRAVLTIIAGGRVPLGSYGEMIQAVQAYAREALDV